MAVLTPSKKYYKNISKIPYEGRDTDNPFAFRWYDENKLIAGKTMKEQLRFACAYWHSFTNTGGDPFGSPTHIFPWNNSDDPVERAKDKMDAAFEFMTKLGVPYYCFHDVDVVDYTNDIAENDKRLSNWLITQAKTKRDRSKITMGYCQPVFSSTIYERCFHQS